jgi:hypothetical protein
LHRGIARLSAITLGGILRLRLHDSQWWLRGTGSPIPHPFVLVLRPELPRNTNDSRNGADACAMKLETVSLR